MEYTLITGGAGFIGSHICIELYKLTKNIVVIDNYSNSSLDIEKKIKKFTPQIIFLQCDIRDTNILTGIFCTYKITSVIHLAALKSVNDSLERPLDYYNTNVMGTLNLINIMKKFNCFNFIFSSSATVYGNQLIQPIKENRILEFNTTNPYGTSKLIIEKILEDLSRESHWNIRVLRYFNPVGCHESGLIGENITNHPPNLFPVIINIYNNPSVKLNIFGNDYNTKDGTCIRDYIHVVDLARAHVSIFEDIKKRNTKYDVFNIGSGRGYSVLEIVKCFNKVCNNKIQYEFKEKRKGDIAICYADTSKAFKCLGWKPIYTLNDMINDTVNYADNLCKQSDTKSL